MSGEAPPAVRFWDTSTGRQFSALQMSPDALVRSLALSSDATKVATGNMFGELSLWDSATGNELWQTSAADPLTSVVVTPNGDRGVTAGYGGHLVLWNLESGSPIRTFGDSAAADPAHFASIALTDGGRSLLSATTDGEVRVWEVASGGLQKSLSTEDAHEGRVDHVAVSSGGRHVVSAAGKKYVIWDLDAPEGVVESESGTESPVSTLKLSPDGSLLAVGTEAGDVRIGGLDSHHGLPWDCGPGHDAHVAALGFSKSGYKFVSGDWQGNIHFYDRAVCQRSGMEEGFTFFEVGPNPSPVSAIALSPQGELAASGGRGGAVTLWDTATGKPRWTSPGHTGSVESLDVSDDGERMVSVGWDGTMKLWDVSTGKSIYSAVFHGATGFLAWTGDGYFAGTAAAARNLLAVVDGNRTYAIDQFFDRFYNPGIIRARVLGEGTSELESRSLTAGFAEPPKVEIVAPLGEPGGGGSLEVTVRAVDHGGGVKDIRLYVNEKLAGGDRGLGVKAREEVVERVFQVALSPGKNLLRAVATSDESIESAPFEVEVEYKKKVSGVTCWVLAVGINKYKNGAYNLNYARADAEAIREVVKKRGGSLFDGIEVVELYDEQARAGPLREALEGIRRRAKPEDVLVIYYSGQGVADD